MKLNNEYDGNYKKTFIGSILMVIVFDFICIFLGQDEIEMNIIWILFMLVANVFFGAIPLFLLLKYWQDLKYEDKLYNQKKRIEKEKIKTLSKKEKIKYFFRSHSILTTTIILYIIFSIIFILIGIYVDNNDTGGSSDNDYKTNCYTRSDGKRCCTSCKKTSYGDIGCGTTCN